MSVQKQWTIGACAVVAASVAAACFILRQQPALHWPAYRAIDARLSGWVYAAPQRNQQNPLRLRLAGIAGEILTLHPAGHETGVARLVTGNIHDAIADLHGAATTSPDPAIFNDLGAAMFSEGTSNDDMDEVVDALGWVDRSLALQATPEARFNRALILTSLGVAGNARAEWSDALLGEPSADWASEIRQRMAELNPRKHDRKSVMAALDAAALRGDRESLRGQARRDAQYARVWGESVCLTRWADAIRAGDVAAQEQYLAAARIAGETLQQHAGERLLSDAVAAIDRASVTEAAGAYIDYRAGRMAYDRHDSAAAAHLQNAERSFRRMRSPMALVVRYYLGSIAFADGRLRESAATLDGLAAAHLEDRGYRALAAQIAWERGGCRLSGGDESAAVDIFNEARAIASGAGEHDLAATLDSLSADALDVLGDTTGAWSARRRALKALSAAENHYRVAVLLSAAAKIRMLRGEHARARTLLDLAMQPASRANDALLTTSILIQRAEARAQTGDASGAQRDLAECQRSIPGIGDERMRQRLTADRMLAAGVIAAQRNPVAAIDAFGAAAAHYERTGELVHLPRVYLERGRAERRARLMNAAKRDVAAGIALFEKQRTSVRDFSQRVSLFAAAGELFEEAIGLALDGGDAPQALLWTERWRARTLLDHFAPGNERSTEVATLPDIQSRLAADAAIVEYVFCRDHFVAFVIRPRGMQTISLAATRSLTDMHEALIAPLCHALDGVKTVAFVPDPAMSRVPFHALYDERRRRYLIEDFDVLQSPSASFALAASARSRQIQRGPLLAVAATAIDRKLHPDLAPLDGAVAEATVIAAMKSSRSLTGADSNIAAFRNAAIASDVVHFAGHAIADDHLPLRSRLVLADGDLDARAIAAMRFPRTRLVYLSACSTGRTKGSDVSGLSTAFLMAGVPSVVATTTEVDDRFAHLIGVAFQRRFAKSGDAAEAMANVVREQIRNGVPVRQWSSVLVIGGSPRLVRGRQ